MDFKALNKALQKKGNRPGVRRKKGEKTLSESLQKLAPAIRKLSEEGFSIPQIYEWISENGGPLPWKLTTFKSMCSRNRDEIGY